MDNLRKALLWAKTHSLWFLGLACALLAVAFLGKRSARSDLAEAKPDIGKTSGSIIEEQAREADSLNADIEKLNSIKPLPAEKPQDKSMGDLLSEYEKL